MGKNPSKAPLLLGLRVARARRVYDSLIIIIVMFSSTGLKSRLKTFLIMHECENGGGGTRVRGGKD